MLRAPDHNIKLLSRWDTIIVRDNQGVATG